MSSATPIEGSMPADAMPVAAANAEAGPSSPPRATAVPATSNTTAPPPLTPTTQLEPQSLLILVGLPGAGKTTFAAALTAFARQPGRRTWTRASQDDSPRRLRYEAEDAARAALRRGENVVVDRVDFDPDQRAHFVTLAQQAGVRTICLVLSPPLSVLRERLTVRTGHPTLPDAETALSVLERMRSQFVPPSRGEGIERTLTVSSWESVEEVLARIEVEGVRDDELPVRPAWFDKESREREKQREANRGRGRGRGGLRGGWGRGGPRGGYGYRGGYAGGRGGYAGGPHSGAVGGHITGPVPGVHVGGGGGGYRGHASQQNSEQRERRPALPQHVDGAPYAGPPVTTTARAPLG